MIEIKFMGSADRVREEMARMLGLKIREKPLAQGGVIPYPPATEELKKSVIKALENLPETMNADTAEALETPVDAPRSAQDAPETKGEETVAEAAETATAKAESAPDTPETDAPVLTASSFSEGVTEIRGEPENEPRAAAKATPTEVQIDEANDVMGFPKPEQPAQAITLVQARERMNGLRQKFGAKAVRQVLDTIGFPKFTDVPTEKYPELMVLCDAMEAGMTNA